MEEKFSEIPNKFGVGPKKVGSIGFPETRHVFFFFFWPYLKFGQIPSFRSIDIQQKQNSDKSHGSSRAKTLYVTN